MSAIERLESLRTRHSQLERDLHDEVLRPMPSDETVRRIKREKLRLKDEMTSLTMAS